MSSRITKLEKEVVCLSKQLKEIRKNQREKLNV